MRFYNKTTFKAPPWGRGTIVGPTSQLAKEAGARPLFSNPLEEESFDSRFDRRQTEQMNVKEAVPTDKSVGGGDA